jgi:hypothetical protein
MSDDERRVGAFKVVRSNNPRRARHLRVKSWELELSDLSELPFRHVTRCLDMIEELQRRL